MGKGEQTRQLIVDRALTMAQRLGLEQITLGALAEELDLSKSGLFAHFKSKEQLQLEVVKEVVERFTRIVILPALTKERGCVLRHGTDRIRHHRVGLSENDDIATSFPGGAKSLAAGSSGVGAPPSTARRSLSRRARAPESTLRNEGVACT